MSTTTDQPSPARPKSHRWRVIAAVATVVVVAGVVAAVLLRSDKSQQSASSPSLAPTTAPSAGASVPSQSTVPPGSSVAPVPGFAYQPLWPFTGTADAAAWQQSYRSGGHQPWHLDAGATAQSFTQNYLGYADLNLVTSSTVQGGQAWIGVGYTVPNGSAATAAVIHLAKLGSGSDAPWEVVGTRDTTLTLTQPAYGSTVTSPVTVGGRITGVDENLKVQVRQLENGQVGQSDDVPAGGQNAPWSVPVPFTAPAGDVLTIAVSTGGHTTGVERFAITGVVAGSGAAAAK